MMKKIIRDILNQKFAREIASKIAKLEIKHSSIDEDGDPFVELETGEVFFGHLPPEGAAISRALLRYKIPNLLPECMQVASDICVRYFEAGLKYKGPKKEAFYKVREGDVVAEMGAYEGFYTVSLSKKVGREGRIIAIEAMPDNFRLLEKNCIANRLENVLPVNRAVWSEDKDMCFNRKKGDFQSGSIDIDRKDDDNEIVRAETLDTILEGKGFRACDFMLIQLNGAETNALEGLTICNPTNLSIAARYTTRKSNGANQVIKLMKDRGYQVDVLKSHYIYGKVE